RFSRDWSSDVCSSDLLETVRTVVKSAMNDRQLLLFSATPVEDFDQVTAILGRKPETVKIGRKSETAESNVNHYYLLSEQREKAKLLQKIAAMPGMKGLVFVRDVGNMTVLAEKLKFEKVSVEILHSELNKNEREKALKALRNGQ